MDISNSSSGIGVGGGDSAVDTADISHVTKLKLRAAQREKALNSLKPAGISSSGGGGGSIGIGADFSNMKLKEDHIQRPCWTCPDGTINLEAFHDL